MHDSQHLVVALHIGEPLWHKGDWPVCTICLLLDASLSTKTLMNPWYFSGTLDLMSDTGESEVESDKAMEQESGLSWINPKAEIWSELKRSSAEIIATCKEPGVAELDKEFLDSKETTGFKGWVSPDLDWTRFVPQHDKVSWFDSQSIKGLCFWSQSTPRS